MKNNVNTKSLRYIIAFLLSSLVILSALMGSPDFFEKIEPPVAEAPTTQTIEKAPLCAVSATASTSLVNGATFNSRIPADATAIVFTDVEAPDGAVDLSSAKDGGVVGWLSSKTYYVSTQRKGICAQANSDSSNMFSAKSNLKSIDLTMLRTDNVKNMFSMFAYLTSVSSLDLSNFNTANVTNMKNMFGSNEANGDSGFTSLDLSSFNTSRVTDMSFMFNRCTKLASLNVSSFDTSNVTTMRCMFQQVSYGERTALTELDVSSFNTSKVTDMGWMFYGLSELKYLDVSGFDTSRVENMHHMFSHSHKLSGLDVSGWNVSRVRSLNATFHSTSVKTLDLRGWDTSKCESFAQMFEACMSLTEIKGIEKLNTSSGKDFYEMFKDCTKLVELDISSLDTTNADDSWIDPQRNAAAVAMKDMFLGMTALEKITLGERFSFAGSEKCKIGCSLPTSIYSRWFDENTGLSYDANSIPDKTAATYVLGPAPKSYTVVFSGNGAFSGNIRNQIHEEGREYPAPESTYVREGYVFTGWNTNQDGSGIEFKPGDALCNLTTGNVVTLYAQWKSTAPGADEGDAELPDNGDKAPSADPGSIAPLVITVGAVIALGAVVLFIHKRRF